MGCGRECCGAAQAERSARGAQIGPGLERLLALDRPPRARVRVVPWADVPRRHGGDRALHDGPGDPLRPPGAVRHPPRRGRDRESVGRLPRPADGNGHRRADGDGDRLPARPRDRRVAERVRAPVVARACDRVDDRDARRLAVDRLRAVWHADVRAGRVRVPVAHERRRRLRPLVLRRRVDAVADRAAADSRERAGGAAGDPRPCARGVLRRRQDAHRDDAPRAAAGGAAVGRHRRDARRRAHHRRHGDHRDPARRDAALHRVRRCAAAQHPEGDGIDADDVRLRERADRRDQPAGGGVRRRLRAAVDGPCTDLRGGRRRTTREALEMMNASPPPVRRLPLTGTEAQVIEPAEQPTVVMPAGSTVPGAPSFTSAPRRKIGSSPLAVDRMHVDALSIAYGSKLAVKEVSLPIRQGEVLALIGPSGCGKTTLLRSLNRLTELTKTASMKGRILLDGEDIATLEPTALRRRVTMVFQQPNPFPMSVFDNVAYVLREQASRRPRKAALQGAVRSALERAGLYDEVASDLAHPALRLSGGQQQRLCIARALAADPEVLLLDEPCSALDPASTQRIEELIVHLREQVAVVIVTHNLQQAYRIADRVAFMYLGELVEFGPAEQVFGSPREARTKEYVSGGFG